MKNILLIMMLLTFAGKAFGQDGHRFIFPADKKLKLDPSLTEVTRYTPTISDIDSADKYFTQYFVQYVKHAKANLPFKDYYRQYAGLVILGKKYIFINASCHMTDYFHKNTFTPEGRGQCYFRTTLNLEDKSVVNFYFIPQE